MPRGCPELVCEHEIRSKDVRLLALTYHHDLAFYHKERHDVWLTLCSGNTYRGRGATSITSGFMVTGRYGMIFCLYPLPVIVCVRVCELMARPLVLLKPVPT